MPAAIAQPATERKPVKKGAERRKSPRFRLDSRGQLYVCPSSSKTVPVDVNVCDVSATGVGVIAPEPLPLGQKYVVKEATISKSKSVLFTVVRSERVAEGKFSIGLHASHLLEEGNFVHSESCPLAHHTSAMAKLLLLALLVGCLTAVLYFQLH